MFNPYCIFTKELLDAFEKSGKRYFVRQTFKRGIDHFNTDIKAYFLVCHYDNLDDALAHFNAIAGDGNRFLYDRQIPEHRSRLYVAAQHPRGFKVYANVFEKNWLRHITNRLKYKVRRYVDNTLQWRPANSETVDCQFYSHFGETHALIKLRNQEVRLKLEDIETIT